MALLLAARPKKQNKQIGRKKCLRQESWFGRRENQARKSDTTSKCEQVGANIKGVNNNKLRRERRIRLAN